MKTSSSTRYLDWQLGCLALLLGIAVIRLAETWSFPEPYDATHTYFPAARRLLSEGFLFFIDRESYRVAPLTYIWPALWQLDVEAIRVANAGLFLAAGMMLWRTAELLGGMRAAVVAVMLFVLHPELRHYFGAGWAEPFYVTGISALFLAATQIILGAKARWRWIFFGALGLAITLLGRPALQLLAPALLLGALLTWACWPYERKAQGRRAAQSMTLMVAIGLIPGLIVVIKNGLLFDLWGIATGAGAGLYLGLHPISQGTEPAYYGLDYDVNAIAGLVSATGGDPLNLASDQFLRAIAIETLKEYSWPQRLIFFARKLWWWLFYHPVELMSAGSKIRGIRLFELLSVAASCAVMTWAWLRNGRGAIFTLFGSLPRHNNLSPAAIGSRRACASGLLLLGTAALLVQLLPVLYNSRYSTGLLEPWLCVLAGVSWSILTQFLKTEAVHNQTGTQWILSAHASSAWSIFGKFLTVILIPIIALFFSHPRRIEVVSMDPLNSSLPVTALIRIENTTGTQTTNISRIATNSWQLLENPAALVLPLLPSPEVAAWSPKSSDNSLWRLRFSIDPPQGGKCRHTEIEFTAPHNSLALPRPILDVIADGKMREYLIYATHQLRPAGAGDLRIAFRCPVGTIVTWGGGELIRPEIRSKWNLFKDDGYIGNDR